MRPAPIKKIELGQNFSTNKAICDLERKLNEIIDCINYLTDPRTPPNQPPRFRGNDSESPPVWGGVMRTDVPK